MNLLSIGIRKRNEKGNNTIADLHMNGGEIVELGNNGMLPEHTNLMHARRTC